ncbi:hypothetical protein scyTo_0009818 [Scyliorhinus torazame]|uniref:Phosphorylase b kinase regulatory subunit n=1 Tax=Scyliorhinus torazame TaxID=75743 RepID=A0A401NUD0_SCYTO|nr:hypothetical protein [Scyliorhinus torazame]
MSQAEDASLYLPSSLLSFSPPLLNPTTGSAGLLKVNEEIPFIIGPKDFPNVASSEIDCKALVEQLKTCSTLQEQFELIHIIYKVKGIDWDTNMTEDPSTSIRDLLRELPLPLNELTKLIEAANEQNTSLAILTQEIVVYLAMYIRTEPNLFAEMFRLRIGLIIQVMATELASCLNCTGEAATEHLISMKPFDLKSLLHHILSGKEFEVEEINARYSTRKHISIHDLDHTGATKSDRAGINKLKIEMKQTGSIRAQHEMDETHKQAIHQLPHVAETLIHVPLEGSNFVDARHGQWLRRRRIDGALNRVPIGFYRRVWNILQKCQGLAFEGSILRSSTTEEMTPGEIKFAVQVETFLNSVPHPEYRQLLVETILVLTMLADADVQIIGEIIRVDRIAHMANNLFIEDQTALGADDIMLEKDIATGICKLLYDSAPSGRFGSMTYLLKAVVIYVDEFLPGTGCAMQ